jgi:hypothetical protein
MSLTAFAWLMTVRSVPWGAARLGAGTGCGTRNTVPDGRATGKHGDRGNDARVPVAHQFPCPRDPDDHRRDQGVANYLDRHAAVRISENGDPADKLSAEDEQQQYNQPQLPQRLMVRGLAGQYGSQTCRGEQDPDDAQRRGRIPNIGVRHQAEQRDGQHINERQEGGGLPDLLNDRRSGAWSPARCHRQGDEQQARQRTGSTSDRQEKIPVGPKYHKARYTREEATHCSQAPGELPSIEHGSAPGGRPGGSLRLASGDLLPSATGSGAVRVKR